MVQLPSTTSRRSTLFGLAIVLVLFCAPLFVGLGDWDLRSDEAIYSYAVNRIVETGEWLTPRSIQVDGPFLEKPPLKFWIIAGLMKAGLVPQNELGLRVVDAFFGAVAFLYIYAFGVRLAGPICGVVAVLTTFTLDAIVFEHGLRSNNMEAPLFLTYCGGLYHFSRWIEERPPRAIHPFAVAGYFVLGFMTKFVAALFLPIVMAVTIAVVPAAWDQLRSYWRTWVAPVLVIVVAILPWFIFESLQYGRQFWEVIFGAHIYTRFTSALDPAHLQPWHFYFSQTWIELTYAGSRLIAAAAVVVMLVRAWQGSPWHMRLLAVWWLVPCALISIGTSKLFHYAYPFLPPIALAVGWLSAALMRVAAGAPGLNIAALVERAGLLRRRARATVSPVARAVRLALVAGACAAVLIAVLTFPTGHFVWRVGDTTLFRNSSLVRPLLVAAVLFGISGYATLSRQALAALLLVIVLPASSYPMKVARAKTQDHRLQSIRDCASLVHSAVGGAAGVLNAAIGKTDHSLYYYLSPLGTWTEPAEASDEEIETRLFREGQNTLVLMTDGDYRRWRERLMSGGAHRGMPPGVDRDHIIIVMPGPYRACLAPALAAGATPVGPYRAGTAP